MDYNKIIREAVEIYSIKSKSVELIKKGVSSTLAIHNNTMMHKYKIIDDKNDNYCLRLFEFSTDFGKKQDVAIEKAIINSEHEWVSAIMRDTDICVPEPVKSIYDEYVVVVDGVYCLLSKWFEGEWKRHILSLASYLDDLDKWEDKREGESLIKVIATLHKHASEWKIPAGFIRPSYDAKNIIKVFTEIDNIKHNFSILDAEIHKKELEIIKLAGQKAIKKMKTFKKDNMTWGLIHANLIHPHFQIINRNTYPDDYSDVIFGYYMADIARAFFFVGPIKRQFFLDLYSKYFPLPKDYINQIETFFIIRWLEIFYYNMKASNEYPPEDTHLLATHEFGYYLNNESFLFDKMPFFE